MSDDEHKRASSYEETIANCRSLSTAGGMLLARLMEAWSFMEVGQGHVQAITNMPSPDEQEDDVSWFAAHPEHCVRFRKAHSSEIESVMKYNDSGTLLAAIGSSVPMTAVILMYNDADNAIPSPTQRLLYCTEAEDSPFVNTEMTAHENVYYLMAMSGFNTVASIRYGDAA